MPNAGLWQRHIDCDVLRADRWQKLDHELLAHAIATGSNKFWTRGLAQDIARFAPRPLAAAEVEWTKSLGPSGMNGTFFIDGPGLWGPDPATLRCGGGIASINGNGELASKAVAPLPFAYQSGPAAEQYMVMVAIATCEGH